MEALLEEQRKTNALLERLIKEKESDYDMLTVDQVFEQYKIGKDTVRKMFRDPELAVQKYTVPFKVMRKNLLKYLEVRHDYLCEK